MVVVINFDWSIDAKRHRHFLDRATRAMDDQLQVFTHFDSILDTVQIIALGAVQIE